MTKEEYEAEMDDILQSVPEQYREKVRAKAWDDGHAYGYREVIGQALDLADIFKVVKQ